MPPAAGEYRLAVVKMFSAARDPFKSTALAIRTIFEAGKGDRLLFQSQELRTERGRVPLEKRYCPR